MGNVQNDHKYMYIICTLYFHFIPRPWYVEALTPEAKDIVILLDVSQSMSSTATFGGETKSQLAKESVIAALSTLSPRDRVERNFNYAYTTTLSSPTYKQQT